MLVNLDVDGVLAQEDERLWRGETIPEACLHGYWMEREPLWSFITAHEIAEMRHLLNGHNIQIISKREKWLEATTLVWIQSHYPWLSPYIKAIACVGRDGSKTLGLILPDVAIDDSPTQVDNYISHGVPVIQVARHGGVCGEFVAKAMVDRVDAAIRMLPFIQEILDAK